MNVSVDKSFEKDTDKIPDSKILHKVAMCIEQVMASNSIKEVANLKKLQGFKYYYRIKLGEYRAGVIIKDNEVTFERFLHRKDIYKYYP